MLQTWASECVLEMAAPPVAASAFWTLQSAAAMVATQLGTTLRYIMQQHSMWHMAQVRARCNAKGCCWQWKHHHQRDPLILQGPLRSRDSTVLPPQAAARRVCSRAVW